MTGKTKCTDEVFIHNEWVERVMMVSWDYFEGQEETKLDPSYPPVLTINSIELLNGTPVKLIEEELDPITDAIYNEIEIKCERRDNPYDI